MHANLGSSAAPIFLRIALGCTFIWAGVGKMEGTMPVKGEAAATLATMGVQRIRDQAPPGKTSKPTPITPSVVDPTTLEVKPAPTNQPPAQQDPPQSQPIVPQQEPMGPPAPPGFEPPPPSSARALLAFPTLAQVTAPSISPGAGAPDPNRVYAAAEFPDAIDVPRVYGLAMLIQRSAFPPATNGRADAMMQLWPQRLARGMWPVRLAWTVAITEVLAGIFVLVGLLTRASALALAGTMVGALWLTEFGPAMQAGTTVLGFLPDRDPFSVEAWRAMFWQLALFMSACSLACLGCGALGFDRKLFPPPPPAPPTPRPMI